MHKNNSFVSHQDEPENEQTVKKWQQLHNTARRNNKLEVEA
jgi:hypothetical protein